MNQQNDTEDVWNEEEVNSKFEVFTSHINTIQHIARENIRKAQESQLKMVNKRILSRNKSDKPDYCVGDLVSKYKDIIANILSAKLDDRFERPFIIQECHRNSTYILKSLDRDIAQRHIHGNRLKIYKHQKYPSIPIISIQLTIPMDLLTTTTINPVVFGYDPLKE
ncbi:uncharacterized protein EV154DRAFT_570697 [Mucor mucedo]|uniref:uncharacterized protein n=1 Tax=Mucor mucedo TaxID=29922 RepID=UPI00221F5C03|nr:uncharacterized protein EV154DRAFT_570697 [Mucor mucedo]KAI7871118.1 hypothetical protein EV154DRAFT_570697 [Mucor mucedo]